MNEMTQSEMAPGRAHRTKRVRTAVVAVVALAATVAASAAGLVASAPAPAGALIWPASAPHTTQVKAVPTAATPHALDGSVRTVAVVGSTVYMGGDFTKAADPDRTAVDRSWILAFDKATGKITSFAPQLDGMVHSIVPAEDGQSLYVGGAFATVNGTRQPKVARIRTSDGSLMTFKPAVSATVTTMALVGDRLWLGGVFKNVQGRELRVAAVDARTAAIDDRMNLQFTGTHHGKGDGKIWSIEPSPDGRHLLVGGSFAAVNGQARGQIAKIDIAADGTPTLSPWSTTRYAPRCAASVPDSLRDISYSPDGTYFVVGTSGGLPPGDNSTLCDTTARWEENDTANAQPTWVNPTGGDSVYAVEVTGAAVYIGGHFRWSNNVNGRDSLQPGGVGREGIAALDPVNGIPLSWNPGRDRGQAVWQMVSTPDGLYVASDTDRIARYLYRGRIAFFPTSGGLPVPQPGPLVLPTTFHQYAPAAGGTPARALARAFDGTTVGTPSAIAAPPADLASLTGAFQVDGNLYTAHSDGSLRVRPITGEGTYGPATTIELNRLSAFATELKSLRGITYSNGRIYYGQSGSSSLFSRGFSVESRIVGGARATVATSSSTDLHYGYVTSLVVIGDQAYWSDSRTGTLRRSAWSPVTGIAPTGVSTVSPATAGGVSWSTGWFWGVQGAIPNQAPTAAFTSSCTGLTCSFDASTSNDPDGSIVGVQWDFGDGGTATGPTATWRFTAAGTYTVKATVIDDDGAPASTTAPITVNGPELVGTAASVGSVSKKAHTVTLPAAVQPGDQLVVFVSTNAAAPTLAAPAGWTESVDVPTAGSGHAAFTRTATAADAGATVTVDVGVIARADLTAIVYRGVTLGATGGQAGYTTPLLPATPGDLVVSYWADKSATTTAIVAPAGVTVRAERAGTGAGHLTETLGDSVATATTAGGLVGVPTAPVANAAALTLVLHPA